MLGKAKFTIVPSKKTMPLPKIVASKASDGTPPLFAHSGDPNGFPSDHTLLASFLAFGVYRYSKKAGYALMVVAVLIGWARVAAHVHHAVDIIGSIAVTALAYLIVTKLLANHKVASTLKLRSESAHKTKELNK
jgi:membrane-associated phospholipid phosphatase